MLVANAIFHFYDSLIQHSDQVVTAAVSMAEHVHAYPGYAQKFINKCTDNSLSKKAIGALYNTILSYKASISGSDSLVTTHIPRFSHLYAILKALRSEIMFKKKWKRVIIDLNDLHGHLGLNIPINNSGTFRCPLALVKEQLQKHGSWKSNRFVSRTMQTPIGYFRASISSEMNNTIRSVEFWG